jgi:hypothetical protein
VAGCQALILVLGRSLQRFAFNLGQRITLISEAEFGAQTHSAIKVIQYERETL